MALFASSWIPTSNSQAYLAAHRCDDPHRDPSAECRSVTIGSILGGQQSAGIYTFTLALPQGAAKASVVGYLWIAPPYQAGDRLDVETWRGKVTRLSGAHGSFVTTESPLYLPSEMRVLAVMVAFVTLVTVVAIQLWPARRRLRGNAEAARGTPRSNASASSQ